MEYSNEYQPGEQNFGPPQGNGAGSHGGQYNLQTVANAFDASVDASINGGLFGMTTEEFNLAMANNSFDDVQPQPPPQPQQYNHQQGLTPPQELAPPSTAPTFNNPFDQNHHQLQSGPVNNNLIQHGGTPLQQAPQQPHGASYAFNRSYQTGEPGYFAAQPRTDSLESNNGSSGSAPGTPGNGRVAIPRCGTGPMSTEVKVPPRPKPGRKPIEADNQQDRRRTQNRLAQRNFRDRRQQKLSELHDEIDQQRAERQADHARFNNELSQLEQQIKELRAELDAVRSENQGLRDQLCQATQARSTGNFPRDTTGDAAISGLAAPVPATTRRTGPAHVNRGKSPAVASGSGASNGTASAKSSANANTARNPVSNADADALALETDFTNFGRHHRQLGSFRQEDSYTIPTTTAPGHSRSPSSPEASTHDAPARASSPPTVEEAQVLLGIDGKIYDCGFCTDPVVCVCRLNDHLASEALVGMSKSPPQGKGKQLRALSEDVVDGEAMQE